MRASASTRPNKMELNMGTLSVAVSMFPTTTADHGIARKMFVEVPGEDDHPIGYASFDKITGEPVDKDQVVRKVATEYGFVFVEDQEIEALLTLDPRSITINSVHPMKHWHDGVLKSKTVWSLEATPKAVGRKKVPNRRDRIALRALFDTLTERDAFGFGEMVLRGAPKPIVLLPNGELHQVFFSEELREVKPAEPLAEVDLPMLAKVTEAMVPLIDTYFTTAAVEEPSDVRTALIQQFADDKARAGDFAKPAETAIVEKAADDDVDDLLATLTALKKVS